MSVQLEAEPLAATPAPAAPPAILAVQSFGLSDKGLVRSGNEDSFLIAELRKALWVRQSNLTAATAHYSDDHGHLFVVADGMGGHQAGERASALAVTTIETFVLNTFKWFFQLHSPEDGNVLAELQHAIREADQRVHIEGQRHPELSGMGTTLTLAYVRATDLYLVHVGDSRAYLLRSGALYRLTNDHTLVEELVRAGQLTPEQAGRHRLRHVVTNIVGGERPGVRVEVLKLGLEAGDVLLLCSDGLSGLVPDDRICALLNDYPAPAQACEALVAEANACGGSDNVTAVVARFDHPG